MNIHAPEFSAPLNPMSSIPLIAIFRLAACNQGMKTIEEIRRDRLEKLIAEHNDHSTGRGGVAALSETEICTIQTQPKAYTTGIEYGVCHG